MEIHHILDHVRVQVLQLIADKEVQIHTAIAAQYQKDSEPDNIVYAMRVLREMEDRCDTVEETIERLKTKHTELCHQRAKQ